MQNCWYFCRLECRILKIFVPRKVMIFFVEIKENFVDVKKI